MHRFVQPVLTHFVLLAKSEKHRASRLEGFMAVRTCDHLKEDGVYCNSPALKGRNYCYFHLNIRGRRLNMARARALGPEQPLNVPFPEDMHAVQVTLFEVVSALAHKRIDTKHAGLILYAMQQAATNLMQTPDWHGRCHRPEPNQPLLALEFPAFEEQHHLPKGIDLEADPETAWQEAGPLPQGAPPLSPDFGDRVGPPPQTPPSHSDTPTVESTPGVQKTDNKKKRKHHRRADRVPLPKPLWTMKDPDAPFRAYTSDGRELTRADAERWQKRKLQEMVAFAKYGDPNAPLSPDEADVDIDEGAA